LVQSLESQLKSWIAPGHEPCHYVEVIESQRPSQNGCQILLGHMEGIYHHSYDVDRHARPSLHFYYHIWWPRIWRVGWNNGSHLAMNHDVMQLLRLETNSKGMSHPSRTYKRCFLSFLWCEWSDRYVVSRSKVPKYSLLLPTPILAMQSMTQAGAVHDMSIFFFLTCSVGRWFIICKSPSHGSCRGSQGMWSYHCTATITFVDPDFRKSAEIMDCCLAVALTMLLSGCWSSRPTQSGCHVPLGHVCCHSHDVDSHVELSSHCYHHMCWLRFWKVCWNHGVAWLITAGHAWYRYAVVEANDQLKVSFTSKSDMCKSFSSFTWCGESCVAIIALLPSHLYAQILETVSWNHRSQLGMNHAIMQLLRLMANSEWMLHPCQTYIWWLSSFAWCG
jgi:hypothetical protein